MTSLAARPSSATLDASGRLASCVLLVLFVLELLYLTVSFDSQALSSAPSVWLWFIGWSPQFLRLASAIAIVIFVFAGRRVLATSNQTHTWPGRWSRVLYLTVHFCGLAVFMKVTAVIFTGAPASIASPAVWSPGLYRA
jgi:hypothetical protein